MEVQNHTHKVKAVLNFKQAGWFGKDLNRVDGFIYSQGEKVRFLYGKWTEYLKSAQVSDYEEYLKESPQRSFKAPDKPVDVSNTNGSVFNTPLKMMSKVNSLTRHVTGASADDSRCDVTDDSSLPAESPDSDGEIPKSDSSQSLDIPNSRFLWRVTHRPDHAEDYYNFTSFSMILNQEFPELKDNLPPTDSRFRPDVRILELGEVGAYNFITNTLLPDPHKSLFYVCVLCLPDRASAEKNRLEEKQREARKVMKKKSTSWQPL